MDGWYYRGILLKEILEYYPNAEAHSHFEVDDEEYIGIARLPEGLWTHIKVTGDPREDAKGMHIEGYTEEDLLDMLWRTRSMLRAGRIDTRVLHQLSLQASFLGMIRADAYMSIISPNV